MINKYITATILAAITTSHVGAQDARPLPKLVVNITIDQLRTDYLETFLPYYGTEGFKKLFKGGAVYDNAQYTFAPVDRASAIASIFTGTSPYYNGITGNRWLDKASLIPVDCVDDTAYEGLMTRDKSAPTKLESTTVNDELKVATEGKAIVYSIARERDAAILGGGHAADGAFWVDRNNKCWCSSKYYFKKSPDWLDSYNISNITDPAKGNLNSNVTGMALKCVSATGMGADMTPDMLSVTYDAKPPTGKDKDNKKLQEIYVQLDQELATLVSKVEQTVGTSNVLFVLTGTGYCDDKDIDYEKYRIPTGTFYINRTANLLNMYLSAIYGQDKYVEYYYSNQIYLNLKQIEMKRISMADIQSRSQSFLIQNAGVCNAYTSKNMLLSGDNTTSMLRNWYNPDRCGDLIVEVTPGWKLLNEDTKQQYISRESLMAFPIIIYGTGIVPRKVSAPVTIDRIAPTVARAVRIRAPNACSTTPLE